MIGERIARGRQQPAAQAAAGDATACELAFNMPAELKRRPSDALEQKKEKSAKRSARYKLHRWHPHALSRKSLKRSKSFCDPSMPPVSRG